MNENRRYFLKVAGLSAFALTAGVGATVAKAVTEAKDPGDGSYEASPKGIRGKRFAMVIDTRKFANETDMLPIIDACHKYHNVPKIEGPQEVKWIWQDSYAHTFTDDTSPLIPEEVKKRRYFMLCNQCAEPSCVRVCPVQATYQTKQGLVAIDYHRCIGCRFCMAACPYGSRSFNFSDPRKHMKAEDLDMTYPTRMRGVVEKCTFCAERLEIGQMPLCVEVSNGGIIFGDLADPESDVRKALAENFTIRRKPGVGTDPGVYYII